MRAIIIGAGRGARLMPTTADSPKCFAEVGGRRILDWILDALGAHGVDDVCFVGGYRIESVQGDYPQLTYRLNDDWPNNNILASLMYARDLMDEPFVVSYADILYTPEIVGQVVASAADITLAVDTDFRTRYADRTEHPESDAEKMTARNGQVTRVHRGIDAAAAHGEYIGVGKFSATGAKQLKHHFDRCEALYAGGPFREAAVFEKAYLIHLLQEMLEHQVPMTHVDTHGSYWEIDTQQDFEAARAAWGR